jgi:hypothetical protein
MLISAPECGALVQATGAETTHLADCPWTLRLAGASGSCPAVEIYEHDVLIDVVTATAVARLHVRGARSASGPSGPCALAWGRMPATGGLPVVEFRARGWRRPAVPFSRFLPADWLWIAHAHGRVRAVAVTVAGTTRRYRVLARSDRP